jgi:hypothetical membrane protein
LKPKLFTAVLIIAGIALFGLGVFSPVSPFPHNFIGLFYVVSYSLAAIFTYKIVNSKPLRYLSAVLGAIGLVGIMLIVSGTTFGLGAGVIGVLGGYPAFAWGIVLGLYLAL